LAGDEDSVQAADMFGRDASLFGRVLTAMLEGCRAMEMTRVSEPEARERLAEIAELFEFVSGSVDEILETSPELFQVRESAGNIFTTSQTVLNKASDLALGVDAMANGRYLNTIATYALGALALASVILIRSVTVIDTRKRLQENAEKNARNKVAILRLLDEIADLA